jgi:hypothetical protein
MSHSTRVFIGSQEDRFESNQVVEIEHFFPLVVDHIDVHGGISHLGVACGIKENASDDLYAIGFDCGHFGDLSPSLIKYGASEGSYRNIDYVKSQVERLAHQIESISPPVKIHSKQGWE